MTTKKSFERNDRYLESSDGLRRKRLKDESRWKFDPNKSYSMEADDYEDEEDEYRR